MNVKITFIYLVNIIKILALLLLDSFRIFFYARANKLISNLA